MFDLIGGPDTIRTCDLRLRRATLYPTELRVQRTPFRVMRHPIPAFPANLNRPFVTVSSSWPQLRGPDLRANSGPDPFPAPASGG
jgi:hypothetical protein